MDRNFPIFIVFMVFTVALYVLSFVQKRKVLNQWAADNGFAIVKVEQKLFTLAPWRRAGRYPTIRYIMVRYPDGKERCGWIRMRNSWGLIFEKTVEVKWDARVW